MTPELWHYFSHCAAATLCTKERPEFLEIFSQNTRAGGTELFILHTSCKHNHIFLSLVFSLFLQSKHYKAVQTSDTRLKICIKWSCFFAEAFNWEIQRESRADAFTPISQQISNLCNVKQSYLLLLVSLLCRLQIFFEIDFVQCFPTVVQTVHEV